MLLQYAENLLGYRPDYIFTHVSRMVLSKAFWRDLRVLEHLDWTLATRGQTAVLFVVSTAVPTGRRPEMYTAGNGSTAGPSAIAPTTAICTG